jgi:hypothetical protein
MKQDAFLGHVISKGGIIWIRDTGCYSGALASEKAKWRHD